MLREIPYPDPTSTAQTEAIPVIYALPHYVYITDNEDYKIGVWDDQQQKWSSDYVEDLEYNKKEREFSFSIRKFAPIAYLQPKCTDFPYDSWDLRCIEEQVALLQICTRRNLKITIEIHPRWIKLVEMPQVEFCHLVGKEMHPGQLFFALQKSGVHMLPEDEDAERGGIHLKDKFTEERAIMDIA